MTGQHRDDGVEPYIEEPEDDPRAIAKSRAMGKWLVVLGVALLVVLAVAALARYDAQNAVAAAKENGQRVEQNAERADERDRLLQAQIDQFERCVGKPRGTTGCTVAVAPEPEDLPEPVEPVPAPDPAPPIDLMTEGDVRTIVAQVLLEHESRLSDAQIERVARVAAGLVPKPKDGLTPSEAQVRTIVSDVVAGVCANDACRGEDGPAGEDAPPVTDEQLDARLAAYCSAQPGGDCEGVSGEPGPAGRGLVKQDCVNDTTDAGSHWLLTYDKEPLEVTVDGPCRIREQPSPVPSPAPTVP